MAIKLVPTKCGQEHKESLFPVIPCNHIIAFGLHNQRSRKYFFSIIFLNDDVFSGHLLSAFSVFAHWNEWSLRVKECGCAISVSLLCLQTVLCYIHHHPCAESGSTLCFSLSRHWGRLAAVHQLCLVLPPARWDGYTFPSP